MLTGVAACLTRGDGHSLTTARAAHPRRRFSRSLGEQFIPNASLWTGFEGKGQEGDEEPYDVMLNDMRWFCKHTGSLGGKQEGRRGCCRFCRAKFLTVGVFVIETIWRWLIGCLSEGLSHFFSGRLKTGQSANFISSVRRR